jgi:two-component system, OmpR family, heavy metal sensor histidine kinase CusS
MSSRLTELSRRVRTWLRSMEARLMLFFTAGTAVLLIAISITLYGAILHYMQGRAEAFLADKIQDTRTHLDDDDGADDVASQLAAPIPGRPDYWLRIFDAKGHTIAETQGMDDRVPSSQFPAPGADAMTVRDFRGGRGRWFSLASQTVTAYHEKYLIQVAEDRHPDREFLHELRWILRGLVVIGILFSAGMACIATRRGLLPLHAMEQAVARIRAPQLNARLGTQQWPRELAPLAAAFDEMMDRLEESFNRLSQFSADLAHELRTPIANLRGEAEVALTRSRSADEYRHVIESSMEEYSRLTAMTEKLLFLARADAEEAEVKPEELDGRAAIDALSEFYEPYAEELGVALKCDGKGLVKADAILLRRAVANLIENALRFTPRGREVTLQVAEGGVVRIKDTGAGIAPEHLPRLFDRFYQVDPSRRESGTGLGLALVKSIMKLHGGTVSITSELGRGTEATLKFPV